MIPSVSAISLQIKYIKKRIKGVPRYDDVESVLSGSWQFDAPEPTCSFNLFEWEIQRWNNSVKDSVSRWLLVIPKVTDGRVHFTASCSRSEHIKLTLICVHVYIWYREIRSMILLFKISELWKYQILITWWFFFLKKKMDNDYYYNNYNYNVCMKKLYIIVSS